MQQVVVGWALTRRSPKTLPADVLIHLLAPRIGLRHPRPTPLLGTSLTYIPRPLQKRRRSLQIRSLRHPNLPLEPLHNQLSSRAGWTHETKSETRMIDWGS